MVRLGAGFLVSGVKGGKKPHVRRSGAERREGTRKQQSPITRGLWQVLSNLPTAPHKWSRPGPGWTADPLASLSDEPHKWGAAGAERNALSSLDSDPHRWRPQRPERNALDLPSEAHRWRKPAADADALDGLNSDAWVWKPKAPEPTPLAALSTEPHKCCLPPLPPHPLPIPLTQAAAALRCYA